MIYRVLTINGDANTDVAGHRICQIIVLHQTGYYAQSQISSALSGVPAKSLNLTSILLQRIRIIRSVNGTAVMFICGNGALKFHPCRITGLLVKENGRKK